MTKHTMTNIIIPMEIQSSLVKLAKSKYSDAICRSVSGMSMLVIGASTPLPYLRGAVGSRRSLAAPIF